MTAQVGILTKQGVVLAADSAATIDSKNKVFNTANKIFSLGPKHSMAIMIYNQASWMGIPLSIIIGEFCNFSQRRVFRSVETCSKAFIDFIKKKFIKHIDTSISENAVRDLVNMMLEGIIDEAEGAVDIFIESELKGTDINKDDRQALVLKEFLNIIDAISSNIDGAIIPEFKDYTYDMFIEEHGEALVKQISGFASYHTFEFSKDQMDKLIKLIHLEICHFSDQDQSFSGIVFAGFGSEEYFPHITEIHLGEYMLNRLRYKVRRNYEIDHSLSASVVPFAQRDMVDTFFQGVHPSILSAIQRIISTHQDLLAEKLIKEFKIKNSKKLAKLFDQTFRDIGKEVLSTRDKLHVRPIIDSVSYLPNDELIEFAEALINITSLKRKTSDEIQTVGGPIDVVLITKTDGFKWIKSKTLQISM